MDIIKFWYENGAIKCGFIDGETKLTEKFKPKLSLEILRGLAKSKIDELYYSGNDVVFYTNDTKVEIKEATQILKNKTHELYKELKFIADYLEKQQLEKEAKKKLQQTTAGFVAGTIALAGAGVGIGTVNARTPEKITTTQPTTEYVDDSMGIYEENEKDKDKLTVGDKTYSLEYSTTAEELTENKIPTTEQTTTETNTDYKDMLGIGSQTSSDKFISTKENYYDIIEKYANMYGVNPDIICAIATQERGEHSREISPGGGLGLMQIQASVWNGHNLTIHNVETDQDETIYFTTDSLRNLENNIQAGCAIYKMCLDKMEGNYIAALQCYNMGEGSMGSILSNYSSISGKSKSEILESNDFGWLNYTNGHGGDSNYVKNVLRYFDGKINEIGLSTGVHI